MLEIHAGEEWDRTRIGRIYYGVYLEYRAFAEERLGFNRHNLAREHRIVADLLQSLDPDTAEDLRTLRILRNQADYDLHLSPEVIATRLATAVPLAQSMMVRLAALRSSPEHP
jgi:hypothetical protein